MICTPTSGDHNFFNLNPIGLIPSAIERSGRRASLGETASPGGDLKIAKRPNFDFLALRVPKIFGPRVPFGARVPPSGGSHSSPERSPRKRTRPRTGFSACGKLYKTRTGRADARSGFAAHFKTGPVTKKLPILLAGIVFFWFWAACRWL